MHSLLQSNKLSVSSKSLEFCSHCQLGKHHKLPFSDVSVHASSPLHVIHTDVWTSPIISNSGFKYFFIFVDEFSRYVWLYPMRLKSETFAKFLQFISMAENFCNSRVKFLQ